jgi:hypothetical protein
MARFHCPKGCGSTEFTVQRRATILDEVRVNEHTGDVRVTNSLAEGGGRAWVNCGGCAHGWWSQAQVLADVAMFIEERT